jgi:hypothetical protein
VTYSAKILADSVSPDGYRLTSFEVTFPRIVLAEFNTHRVFGRNSASSRAIPVKTMLKRVEEDPFIPVYWGKNQKGMQAAEELSEEDRASAEAVWLDQRDLAVAAVRFLAEDLDLHKQIANRLIEPWLFQTVIVTSSEWANFFNLRRDKAAQPEIRTAAELMYREREESIPVSLEYGQWHLPLVDGIDYPQLLEAGYTDNAIAGISAGRCARVSYLTHDGVRDPDADLELAGRLREAGHYSPFEHAARPMYDGELYLFETPAFKTVAGELVFDPARPPTHFCGNLNGWVSLRKLLPNEAVRPT